MQYNSSTDIIQGLSIKDFINQHKIIIAGRVANSYRILTSPNNDPGSNRDIYGLNQCIHLATTMVLLGSDSEKICVISNELSKQFSDSDPMTIITVSTLHYILTTHEDKEKLEFTTMLQRYKNINWYLNTKIAGALGLN